MHHDTVRPALMWRHALWRYPLALVQAPPCFAEAYISVATLWRAVGLAGPWSAGFSGNPIYEEMHRVMPIQAWAALFFLAWMVQVLAFWYGKPWPRRLAAGFAMIVWWWQVWVIAQTTPTVWWSPYPALVLVCVLLMLRNDESYRGGGDLWKTFRYQ